MRKRMNAALVALAIGTAALASLHAQESEEATIRALELKVADLYKQHRVEAFAPLLDDGFVITFEDGKVYSKTGYLAYTTSSQTHVELVEIPEMKVHLHGDTAVVTGVYHEKGSDHDGSYDYRDRFTDVWMKQSGKWRLVAAHYSLPTN